jgi:hypothetical protein
MELPTMACEQRGSILGSVLGIIVCGGIGGIAAWAVVTALGWDGTPGAIAAAIIGMVVATATWAGGTSLLRVFRLIR